MPETNKPLISICIANYNGEKLLPDCLDSVLEQEGAFEIEIIVHDDASTDDSLKVLSKYPEVTLIRSDDNVGFCISNNRMAETARGEYLLLLNNDAALLSGALSTLLEHSHRPGPARILSLPQYDWKTESLVDRGCLLDPLHFPLPNHDPHLKQVAYVIGACLWIRRSDWLRLGGFPEWMGSIGEDLFLCAHARVQGMRVEVARNSGYRHRQGASFGGNRASVAGLSTSYRRRHLSERNRAAVLLTCTPTLTFAPWATLHFLALISEGLVLSALKCNLTPWREIYGPTLAWVWQKRFCLKNSRAKVQSNRRIGIYVYFQPAYRWRLRKVELLMRHGFPKLI